MSIRRIVYFPDAPLLNKAEPVVRFDPDLARLAGDMLETMHAYNGVGLAAPQVGVGSRLFVMQEPDGPELCFVNPEISNLEGREEGEEGCLSMPHIYAMVPRAKSLVLRAHDVDGKSVEMEAADFFARVVQHEFDHLDGVLFPFRLDILTRQAKLLEWGEERERLLSSASGSTDAT